MGAVHHVTALYAGELFLAWIRLKRKKEAIEMLKKITLAIIILLILVVTGCSPKTPADITGLIYQMEDGSILVVEGISDPTMPYAEWFEKGNYAVVFAVNDKTSVYEGTKKSSIKELKTGQKVEVWATGGLAKSYPLQGTAKRVNILPN
jgi:hypothetical protein